MGQTGVLMPRCGRREGGAVVTPQWAAWWPRPDCPAEGGAAGVQGPKEALQGRLLTPVSHLRSHVLPSDQSAPVRQQLLPDPAQ